MPKRTDAKAISFKILGEPVSKANNRRLVQGKRGPMFIKSSKALSYLKTAIPQIPKIDLMEGPLSVNIRIRYASMRPDLDESVILDAMQGRIYKNDRQVVEKNISRLACDKGKPAMAYVEVTDDIDWK